MASATGTKSLGMMTPIRSVVPPREGLERHHLTALQQDDRLEQHV